MNANYVRPERMEESGEEENAVTEGLGFEPRSPFGRRFSRPVQ